MVLDVPILKYFRVMHYKAAVHYASFMYHLVLYAIGLITDAFGLEWMC